MQNLEDLLTGKETVRVLCNRCTKLRDARIECDMLQDIVDRAIEEERLVELPYHKAELEKAWFIIAMFEITVCKCTIEEVN